MKNKDLLFADFKNSDLTAVESNKIFGGFACFEDVNNGLDWQQSEIETACTDGDVGCCDHGLGKDNPSQLYQLQSRKV